MKLFDVESRACRGCGCADTGIRAVDVVDGAGAGATGAGGSEMAPSSSTDGSLGGGPSIAHRLDSYFDRMKDSILLRRV